VLAWPVAAWLALAPAIAAAQQQPPDEAIGRGAAPSPDAEDAQSFGDAVDALPGGARLAAAGPLTPGLAFALHAGYGYRGETLGTDDRHHRSALEVGASFRPTRWLAFAGRFSGRYDAHRGGGRDSGWVGDPRLAVRLSGRLGDLDLGAQLGVWLPGAEAPSVVLEAITPEALALATLGADRPLAVSMHLGGRLDRSARSIESPELLSPQDRMALGVSEAPTALAALGVRWRSAAGELFAEVSWDAMFGDRAPPLAASPLRAGLGVRRPLGAGLELGLRVEALLSRTPSIDPMEPLAPVEPRISGMIGLTWRAPRAAAGPVVVVQPIEPVEPPKPEPAGLAVRVESSGAPVAGAAVTLSIAGGSHTATTGDDGVARFAGLPAGPAEVAVAAPAMRPGRGAASLVAGASAEVAIELERSLPPGQLRGVVRSSRGKPLAARLTIEPGGAEVASDARGDFQLDLPPGEYDVTITAQGFSPQTRKVRIDQDGVTILNVDMVK
jgi:hypothetical protein